MKRFFIISLLLCTSLRSLSQIRKNQYGFQAGYIKEMCFAKYAPNKSFESIGISGWGFELGYNGSYFVNDMYQLRISPSIEFIEDVFKYSNQGIVEKLTFEKAALKLPAHVIIKPFKNFGAGLVAGVSANFGISNYADTVTTRMKLKKAVYLFEIGFNYTIKTNIVEITPEFKYSFSLRNEAGDGKTEYGRAFDSLYRNSGQSFYILVPLTNTTPLKRISFYDS